MWDIQHVPFCLWDYATLSLHWPVIYQQLTFEQHSGHGWEPSFAVIVHHRLKRYMFFFVVFFVGGGVGGCVWRYHSLYTPVLKNGPIMA